MKICEILVANVKKEDLGVWRSNLRIDCVALGSKLSRCAVRRRCASKCAKFGGKVKRIIVSETSGVVHTLQS